MFSPREAGGAIVSGGQYHDIYICNVVAAGKYDCFETKGFLSNHYSETYQKSNVLHAGFFWFENRDTVDFEWPML